VARRLSISVRTLWRMLQRGMVPPPIRYNRKLVRWRASDLERYLAELRPTSPPSAPSAAAG
jgi:predicted DNA-binding transcriptional regulator AlpA